jgi:hypothetical protein
MKNRSALSKSILSILPMICFSGCSWFGQPIAQQPPQAVAAVPKRDVVRDIRNEAKKAGNLLVIEPVANPAVADLLRRAELADEKGNHAASDELGKQAELIDGSNPVVLQFRAESLLRAGATGAAELKATQSYQASAQLGPLCVRNWLTIAETRSIKKNLAGEKQARAKAADCPVKPVERL